MGDKVYNIAGHNVKSDLGDVQIRNRALLDDGTIVSYDQCCEAGGDPGFGPKVISKYLGRGTIYEIAGVRQYDTGLSKPVYLDFWQLIN